MLGRAVERWPAQPPAASIGSEQPLDLTPEPSSGPYNVALSNTFDLFGCELLSKLDTCRSTVGFTLISAYAVQHEGHRVGGVTEWKNRSQWGIKGSLVFRSR